MDHFFSPCTCASLPYFFGCVIVFFEDEIFYIIHTLNAKFSIIKSERLKIDVQYFLQESMYDYNLNDFLKNFLLAPSMSLVLPFISQF